MNSFTGAGEKGRIYFGGFSTEGVSVSAADLFFEFSYTSKQFTNERVARVEVVGKFIEAGFGRLFGHDTHRVCYSDIVQYAPPMVLPDEYLSIFSD